MPASFPYFPVTIELNKTRFSIEIQMSELFFWKTEIYHCTAEQVITSDFRVPWAIFSHCIDTLLPSYTLTHKINKL